MKTEPLKVKKAREAKEKAQLGLDKATTKYNNAQTKLDKFKTEKIDKTKAEYTENKTNLDKLKEENKKPTFLGTLGTLLIIGLVSIVGGMITN
ncbi:MAG: hypothetical protein OXJ52_01270 [Oligoflexia bacterium]|nr:hypothetical protein [Oligoflexia bacterium]